MGCPQGLKDNDNNDRTAEYVIDTCARLTRAIVFSTTGADGTAEMLGKRVSRDTSAAPTAVSSADINLAERVRSVTTTPK